MKSDSFTIEDLSARPGEIAHGFLNVGETATGPIQLPIVVIHGKAQGPSLCLTSGVHATEYAPIETVMRVITQIIPDRLCGTIVAVPIVSMHMFAQRSGFVSPIDGLNLNKVAPGGDGSISEILVRALLDEVITKCQYHIDLHAGDLGEMLWEFAGYPLTGNAELDEQGEALVRLYSPRLICLSRDGASLPPFVGSIAHSATRRGVVSILAESGGNGTLEERDVQVHLDGIWNVMRYLKMIGGEPCIRRPQISATGRAITRASRAGLLRLKVAVGDTIADGQVVAEISDVFGRTIEEVRVDKGGIAGLIWAHKAVATGDPVVRCWYTVPASAFPKTDQLISSGERVYQ
jgi:predicted deacylase